MPREFEPILEKRKEEERGRNIIQRDIYLRHGERYPVTKETPEEIRGKLAPKGFEQAKVIGEELERIPKVYHSEIERAKDFGETISKATKFEKRYQTRMRLEIGLEKIRAIKGFRGYRNKIRLEKGEDRWLEHFLGFGKKKILEAVSPYEIASKFARHVLTHTRMPERYYSGSKVDLINISHDDPMAAFLAFSVGDQIERDPINPKGKTLAEKMGGYIRPAEGFEIDTRIDREGKKEIKLKFRGKEYNLPQEKLEELASFTKEK